MTLKSLEKRSTADQEQRARGTGAGASVCARQIAGPWATQPPASLPSLRAPPAAKRKPAPHRRHALAAAIAAAVHGLALLALLGNGPEPAPARQALPVMVGVMVEAPAPQAAPVMPALAPSPARRPAAPAPQPPQPPQPPVTTAAATPRSIAVAALSETPDAPEVPAAMETPAPQPALQPAPSTVRAEAGSQAEAVEPPRYEAAYLDNPQPSYPVMSRKLREQGTVRLLVMVSAEGRAATVKIKTGSGYERLDQAARTAVQEWRFVPARRLGQNIEGWVDVPIRFQLEK